MYNHQTVAENIESEAVYGYNSIGEMATRPKEMAKKIAPICQAKDSRCNIISWIFSYSTIFNSSALVNGIIFPTPQCKFRDIRLWFKLTADRT